MARLQRCRGTICPTRTLSLLSASPLVLSSLSSDDLVPINIVLGVVSGSVTSLLSLSPVSLSPAGPADAAVVAQQQHTNRQKIFIVPRGM